MRRRFFFGRLKMVFVHERAIGPEVPLTTAEYAPFRRSETSPSMTFIAAGELPVFQEVEHANRCCIHDQHAASHDSPMVSLKPSSMSSHPI